jgi:hypothetical protein
MRFIIFILIAVIGLFHIGIGSFMLIKKEALYHTNLHGKCADNKVFRLAKKLYQQSGIREKEIILNKEYWDITSTKDLGDSIEIHAVRDTEEESLWACYEKLCLGKNTSDKPDPSVKSFNWYWMDWESPPAGVRINFSFLSKEPNRPYIDQNNYREPDIFLLKPPPIS